MCDAWLRLLQHVWHPQELFICSYSQEICALSHRTPRYHDHDNWILSPRYLRQYVEHHLQLLLASLRLVGHQVHGEQPHQIPEKVQETVIY